MVTKKESSSSALLGNGYSHEIPGSIFSDKFFLPKALDFAKKVDGLSSACYQIFMKPFTVYLKYTEASHFSNVF